MPSPSQPAGRGPGSAAPPAASPTAPPPSARPAARGSARGPARNPEPAEIDPVLEILGGGRIVAYRVDLALAAGSTTAGLLLSQFWFWTNTETARGRDGWFWMTADEIAEQTGLSREEQMTARRRLVRLGVLEEDKRGVPMKLWFRVRKPELIALLRDYAALRPQLWASPEDELRASPGAGDPGPHLPGLPKDKVGRFRKIALGKARGNPPALPDDIAETSAPISAPLSLPSSPARAEAPSHECDPPKGEGEAAGAADAGPAGAAGDLWRRCLPELERRVNVATMRTHLARLRPLSLSPEPDAGDAAGEDAADAELVLGAPDAFSRDWVEKRHLPLLREVAAAAAGRSVAVKITLLRAPGGG